MNIYTVVTTSNCPSTRSEVVTEDVEEKAENGDDNATFVGACCCFPVIPKGELLCCQYPVYVWRFFLLYLYQNFLSMLVVPLT